MFKKKLKEWYKHSSNSILCISIKNGSDAHNIAAEAKIHFLFVSESFVI